ncbi:hypothetical protein Pyn_22371 [Prunus yedoensis var. nudiflora]|uniref:BHLH domain-containing protein n=1 Tax=Prunus yedoensis var. nudiflora TaxID=2094558 RepID=A0A314XT41_PRUYE|nr:hypothetical protein Pyn_22371 [Prunus yedoensis var. nudiflora]
MALSPFTIGLALEENSINHNHMMMINEGNESAESFLHCLSPHQQVDQFEFTPSSPMSSGGDLTVVKKLNHNASVRDRRKKINTLYSTLRSLLPASDQMKKLSNPAAISRAVKCIPELQQQVKGLIQKKEELLSRLRRLQRQGDPMYNEKKSRSTALSSLSASAIAVSWLNDREVVLQISSYVVQKSPLSQIVVDLEDDGLLLLNASSFESFEGRLFYSLHLQVQELTNIIFP